MRKLILCGCILVAASLGAVLLAHAADPTPTPTPTPTLPPPIPAPPPTPTPTPLPGPGGEAEKLEYCAYETISGKFSCDSSSKNDIKCRYSVHCNFWRRFPPEVLPSFECVRKEFEKCTFTNTLAAVEVPKGFVPQEPITLCVYTNTAHPTKVSCLQTEESRAAQPSDCPSICQRQGITCGTEKKPFSKCEYLGPPPQDIGNYISLLYTWSLRILGLVVFAMFMYAGVLRFLGSADPKNIQKSKEIIKNAIYGAVLLLAAVLILNTINPELTRSSFSFPSVERAPPTK